ncbi:MAG: hypothetical protein SGPRY_009080, partial [Prymnesium sp.]
AHLEMKLALLLCSAAAVSAFAPAGPPPAQLRSSSPVMSEAQSTRRAMLASAILLAPAAANVRSLRAITLSPTHAMVIPGLNSPGLVPAKKPSASGRSMKNEAWASIRDSSPFWSPKGIMDSVPKMKGIITPKSAYSGFSAK